MASKKLLPLAAMEKILKQAGADRVSDKAKAALKHVIEEEAEQIAEKATECVKGNVFHRKDIGTKELIEKRVKHMQELI